MTMTTFVRTTDQFNLENKEISDLLKEINDDNWLVDERKYIKRKWFKNVTIYRY